MVERSRKTTEWNLRFFCLFVCFFPILPITSQTVRLRLPRLQNIFVITLLGDFIVTVPTGSPVLRYSLCCDSGEELDEGETEKVECGLQTVHT